MALLGPKVCDTCFSSNTGNYITYITVSLHNIFRSEVLSRPNYHRRHIRRKREIEDFSLLHHKSPFGISGLKPLSPLECLPLQYVLNLPLVRMNLQVDWTLIVLPVMTLLIVLMLLFCILKINRNQFDVHHTQDGVSYRILDV